ncbi:MAG: hypothetical protein IJY52_04365 [Anaerotignum sp.]|nr:hypothetical protein [Anaerotignum sp.]
MGQKWVLLPYFAPYFIFREGAILCLERERVLLACSSKNRKKSQSGKEKNRISIFGNEVNVNVSGKVSIVLTGIFFLACRCIKFATENMHRMADIIEKGGEGQTQLAAGFCFAAYILVILIFILYFVIAVRVIFPGKNHSGKETERIFDGEESKEETDKEEKKK